MPLTDKRILIIEDNSQNRVIYQMMMIKARAQVSFDRQGADGLHMLRTRKKYDLIILDLMLAQGISGFDVFKEIKAESDFSDIPIVAVSAADPAETIPKLQELGFDGFIAKPLDSKLFPRQLERILDGEKVWDSGRTFEL